MCYDRVDVTSGMRVGAWEVLNTPRVRTPTNHRPPSSTWRPTMGLVPSFSTERGRDRIMAMVGLAPLLLVAAGVAMAAGADVATVHVIAHSHEDPGWQLTTDQCE